MKKIIAIGGSNSPSSINRTFAGYTANLLPNVDVEVFDLSSCTLPLYHPSLEAESGIPEAAKAFDLLISSADGIVLSMAEHNGIHTAAFKNLWDWASRIDQKLCKNKPMLMMAASPGGRGGANVLGVTRTLIPHYGGNVIAEFSLPSFHDNFQDGRLVNEELSSALNTQLDLFQESIK